MANLDFLKPADQIKLVIASRTDFDWAVAAIREHRLDQRFMVLISAVFGGVRPDDLTNLIARNRVECPASIANAQIYLGSQDPRSVMSHGHRDAIGIRVP